MKILTTIVSIILLSLMIFVAILIIRTPDFNDIVDSYREFGVVVTECSFIVTNTTEDDGSLNDTESLSDIDSTKDTESLSSEETK